MAQGTFTVFQKFYNDLVKGNHKFASDTYKMAIITTLPAAADSVITKASYTEVTTGGTYTGAVTATINVSESAGKTLVDITNNPSWAQNGANPSNAVAMIVFNDTHASKICVGFVDLTEDGGTTPINMSTDNLNVTINASGLLDVGA